MDRTPAPVALRSPVAAPARPRTSRSPHSSGTARLQSDQPRVSRGLPGPAARGGAAYECSWRFPAEGTIQCLSELGQGLEEKGRHVIGCKIQYPSDGCRTEPRSDG